MYVSCHRHFFPVLLLNQRWSPPLTLQASHCSTFRILCDVPSTAVFCSESIECFPGIVSKFFLKLLVTIPVAPIITGTIVHFRFHIRQSLYINSCILTSFPLHFAKHLLLLLLLSLLLLLLLLLLLQLSCHSVAVVLTPVQTKQIGINIHKRNNTKTQYTQNKTQ